MGRNAKCNVAGLGQNGDVTRQRDSAKYIGPERDPVDHASSRGVAPMIVLGEEEGELRGIRREPARGYQVIGTGETQGSRGRVQGQG